MRNATLGTNKGHGHVYARPDGQRTRCGGPGLCEVCNVDAAELLASKSPPTPPIPVDPNDRNWGEVELFRWQYGVLPAQDDFRPLVYPDAFAAAAKAVREGKVDPFNASEMLKVAGLQIRELEANLDR